MRKDQMVDLGTEEEKVDVARSEPGNKQDRGVRCGREVRPPSLREAGETVPAPTTQHSLM